MIKRTFALTVIAGVISLAPVIATAADPAPTKTQTQKQTIYGSQLMTNQERAEYRSKMRSMKTLKERNAYRQEHHNQMQERARAKGVTLPDMPPAAGKGMGPGNGGMMGPGGGMGGGMGGGTGAGGGGSGK